MRGPNCWAKLVHFWKPWKHAFWPPSGCRESFSMLPSQGMPCQVLWSKMLGLGCGGQRQLRFSKWSNFPCSALLPPCTQQALSYDHFAYSWCAESSPGALSAMFEPHLSQTTAGSPSSVQAKRCQRTIYFIVAAQIGWAFLPMY